MAYFRGTVVAEGTAGKLSKTSGEPTYGFEPGTSWIQTWSRE